MPTSAEWEQILLPALRDVKQTLSDGFHSRRLHIFPKTLLPVAIALGFVFPKTAGFHLHIHDYGLWTSEEQPARSTPLRRLVLDHSNGDPTLAVVELAISRHTELGTSAALAEIGLVPGHHLRLTPPKGPSQQSIKDAAHALAIAQQIGAVCRELRDTRGVTHIHLFAALPAFLGVLVGHHLSALCPITVYEFSQATSNQEIYQPVGTLR